tara:strand:- start:1462 stop:1575 length:114 start_codon:yes stop_codon:yes gene_type:complete
LLKKAIFSLNNKPEIYKTTTAKKATEAIVVFAIFFSI